jgi:hypothetical protein
MRRVLGREQEILHGAGGVSSHLEVHGEFRRDFTDAIAINHLAAVANATMNLRPTHRWQQVVRHVAVKHVAERVARGNRAVRQFDQSGGRQELISPYQRFATFLHPRRLRIESRGDRDRRALHADDARAL